MEKYELDYQHNVKTKSSFFWHFRAIETPTQETKWISFSRQSSSTTEKCSNETLMNGIFLLLGKNRSLKIETSQNLKFLRHYQTPKTPTHGTKLIIFQSFRFATVR